LHRKNSLIKAEQNFINDAIYLSLFYRDEAGKPVIINRNQILSGAASPLLTLRFMSSI
jgi:hypothetical protein